MPGFLKYGHICINMYPYIRHLLCRVTLEKCIYSITYMYFLILASFFIINICSSIDSCSSYSVYLLLEFLYFKKFIIHPHTDLLLSNFQQMHLHVYVSVYAHTRIQLPCLAVMFLWYAYLQVADAVLARKKLV